MLNGLGQVLEDQLHEGQRQLAGYPRIADLKAARKRFKHPPKPFDFMFIKKYNPDLNDCEDAVATRLEACKLAAQLVCEGYDHLDDYKRPEAHFWTKGKEKEEQINLSDASDRI